MRKPPTPDDTGKVVLRLPPDFHKRLRAIAALEKRRMGPQAAVLLELAIADWERRQTAA